jgi:hypothetical protein
MKSWIQFIIYKQIYERQDLDFMQKWAFMGPQWGPIVGWGLGLGLVARAQAHHGLGHGPKSSAHSWALMKPTRTRTEQQCDHL